MWLSTEAIVHLTEYSFFQILQQDKNLNLFFSVVRVHLAEHSDPFGHTRSIGRRLSMAELDYHS